MDSNLSLTLGFKGQLKLNAEAVPMQEGYLKLGGNADGDIAFGVACSSSSSSLDEFKKGISDGYAFRGIAVFDDAIAQNSPAHPGKYLDGLPCAVLNHGFMWLANWGKTATGAADPVIGSKVIFKDATGEIEFIGSSANVPSNWTQISNASVRSVDDAHGALIYLN